MAPCVFGEGAGDYDGDGALDYGLMFHSFDYPDETGTGRFGANLWRPRLVDGVLTFPHPEDSALVRKDIRAMQGKQFGIGRNLMPVEAPVGDPQ